MSLLSYTELCELVESGAIQGVHPDQVNGTSIDITLGNRFLVEKSVSTGEKRYVSLRDRTPLDQLPFEVYPGRYFSLAPGRFVLAQSEQVFNLPHDISAEYKLKSSMARIGLEHLNAGWCDPGWHGSALTLELKNLTQYHTIILHPGDRIGQMVFFRSRPVPRDRSYAARGRYNGDTCVQGIKP